MVDGKQAVAVETLETIDGQPTVVRRAIVGSTEGAIEFALQAPEASWDEQVDALEQILAGVTLEG